MRAPADALTEADVFAIETAGSKIRNRSEGTWSAMGTSSPTPPTPPLSTAMSDAEHGDLHETLALFNAVRREKRTNILLRKIGVALQKQVCDVVHVAQVEKGIAQLEAVLEEQCCAADEVGDFREPEVGAGGAEEEATIFRGEPFLVVDLGNLNARRKERNLHRQMNSTKRETRIDPASSSSGGHSSGGHHGADEDVAGKHQDGRASEVGGSPCPCVTLDPVAYAAAARRFVMRKAANDAKRAEQEAKRVERKADVVEEALDNVLEKMKKLQLDLTTAKDPGVSTETAREGAARRRILSASIEDENPESVESEQLKLKRKLLRVVQDERGRGGPPATSSTSRKQNYLEYTATLLAGSTSSGREEEAGVSLRDGDFQRLSVEDFHIFDGAEDASVPVPLAFFGSAVPLVVGPEDEQEVLPSPPAMAYEPEGVDPGPYLTTKGIKAGPQSTTKTNPKATSSGTLYKFVPPSKLPHVGGDVSWSYTEQPEYYVTAMREAERVDHGFAFRAAILGWAAELMGANPLETH
eukprot:g12447.t1